MDKRQAKVEFSEYDFLALLLAVKKDAGENPIVNITELEEELFPFATNEEYKDLFEDIIVRDNIDKKYVYFRDSIVKGAVTGMLTIIMDSGDDYKIVNNLDEDESKLIIKDSTDMASKMKCMLLSIRANDKANKKYGLKPKKENN